jgi:hypothetical protein
LLRGGEHARERDPGTRGKRVSPEPGDERPSNKNESETETGIEVERATAGLDRLRRWSSDIVG